MVLLLPGTIIHELSHFLVATVLRVPTGELSVIPTIEKDGEVKAGKLFLGQTDPFRLSLIGLAPILIGLFLIYLVGVYFIPSLTISSFTPGESIRLPQGWFVAILLFVVCYLLFVVSLTMFSSKKDMEGLKIAVPIILILFISLYFIGVRIFFDESLITRLTTILTDLNYYLLLAVIINGLIFLLIYGSKRLLWRFRSHLAE